MARPFTPPLLLMAQTLREELFFAASLKNLCWIGLFLFYKICKEYKNKLQRVLIKSDPTSHPPPSLPPPACQFKLVFSIYDIGEGGHKELEWNEVFVLA